MKVYVLLFLVFILGIGVLVLSTFTQKVKQEEQVAYVEDEQIYADTLVPSKKKEEKLNTPKNSNERAQLNDRLKSVAKQYEKNMQFPPYSQPLSKKQFDLLNPNIFRAVNMKLDPSKEVKASLKLNAFRIFKGENIEVSVTLSTEGNSDFSLESIELLSRKEIVATVSFTKDKEDENTKYFSASYAPSLETSALWSQELLIRAVFHDEHNKKYVIASSFKYLDKEAELSDVKQSYVDASELIIPLELKTYSDGRYLVKANLFTKSGEPIAHVYAKEDLTEGRGELLLKVHASSLRYKNAEGPYILKDFTIVKIITSVGTKKEYGKSLKSEYEVNGFSLDSYSSEPYHNEAQEQKLDFLKKISS